MSPKPRRFGKFTISRELLFDFEAMKHIMQGVVVWHTESNFADDIITYRAECEHFDPILAGTIPLEYEPIVTTKKDDGKISVEWRKVEGK